MSRILAGLALALFLASPVSAASAISLDQPSPSLGSTVTFSTTVDPARYDCVGHARCARIEVLCYQSGSLVYGEAGALDHTFRLGGGGSIWLTVGGPADCIANLFRFDNSGPVQTYVLFASTSFAAGG